MPRRPITVSYAYKKDTKGERHGTPAERMMADQMAATMAAQSRPNQLFSSGGPSFSAIACHRCCKYIVSRLILPPWPRILCTQPAPLRERLCLLESWLKFCSVSQTTAKLSVANACSHISLDDGDHPIAGPKQRPEAGQDAPAPPSAPPPPGAPPPWAQPPPGAPPPPQQVGAYVALLDHHTKSSILRIPVQHGRISAYHLEIAVAKMPSKRLTPIRQRVL